MADPFVECRRLIATHSRSFDLASRLFSAERRDEVAALYAWCRLADDAIDLAPPEAHRDALDGLERNLRSIYDGEPQNDPVLHCFQIVVRRRQIPIEYPSELLAGLAMDARNEVYPTIDDLLVYCWRVAGTVGLMMCHTIGISDGRARFHAAHLGIAMQLTNICRDVLEDWERGRVYLPGEMLTEPLDAWLLAHRSDSDRPPLPEGARDDLAEAVRRMLRLADRYYESADAGMAYLEPRNALAVRTARLVYSEIGVLLERRGCDVLPGRVVVPTTRKLRLLARALFRYVEDRRRRRSHGGATLEGVLGCSDVVRLQ